MLAQPAGARLTVLMDTAYRTPLLDLFRRGDVPREIRILAARGVLAPRAHEQVALLMLLTGDDDAGVRLATEETLLRIPRHALEAFLARTDVSADVRQFFSARGVQAAADPAAAAEGPLVDTAEPEEKDAVREGAAERLARLSVTDRLKAAMRGTREERAILIRDHNKIIAAAVLSNPRIHNTEVETFARMPNVSEDVLRIIGHTRAWVKRYAVVQALARNPKSPLAVSLPLVSRLHDRDLRATANDHNVPEPVRVLARKLIVAAASPGQR